MENNNGDNGNETPVSTQDSILLSMKDMVGINPEDGDFDLSLINNINAAILTLNQIGVGSDRVFIISGPEQTWDDFIGDAAELENVKLYIYLKLRLTFDPPTNAFVADAIKEQIREMDFRLNVQTEKGLEVD